MAKFEWKTGRAFDFENPVNFMENVFERGFEKMSTEAKQFGKEFGEWGKTFAKNLQDKAGGKVPFVNSIEHPQGYRLEMAAPGLSKQDFSISVEGKNLIIKVQREQALKEGENYTRREFDFNEFERSFQLPEEADTTKISAKYENGLLTLDIAKKEGTKEKKDIKID